MNIKDGKLKLESECDSDNICYCSLFKNSRDGIFRIAPDKKYNDANPALLNMLGYKDKSLLFTTSSFKEIYLHDFFDNNCQHLDKTVEVKLQKKDGDVIWTEINTWTVNGADGKILYYEGIVRDISERKAYEDQIKYIGYHDNLTGLYNRTFFNEELKRINVKRHLPLSVIIGDLNGLKLANDAFGHHEGDRLLKIMSSILKKSCRSKDIISRWGGDEFAILLPDTNQIIARDVVKRIHNMCKNDNTTLVPPSIALGYASKTSEDQDIDDVLKAAEGRMYRKKLIESKKNKSYMLSTLEEKLLTIESKEHLKNIKKYGIELGRSLNFTEEQLSKLKLLARYHDIGKVAIPITILHKSSPLSSEEQKTLKRHSEIGYRIARASDKLSSIAEEILYIHESWNGSGYPHGLRNNEIPILSRIISILDAYDLMTNQIINKERISITAVFNKLKGDAGIKYDPDLITQFVKIMNKS